MIRRECGILRDPNCCPQNIIQKLNQTSDFPALSFIFSTAPSFRVFPPIFLTLLPKSMDNWVHWLPKHPKYCCHFLVWIFQSVLMDWISAAAEQGSTNPALILVEYLPCYGNWIHCLKITFLRHPQSFAFLSIHPKKSYLDLLRKNWGKSTENS